MALIGAAAAMAGVAAAIIPSGSPAVRIAVLLGSALFAPGYALVRRLPATREMAETIRVALAFPFSCAIFVSFLFLAQLFGFGFGIAGILLVPLLLLSASLLMFPDAGAARPDRHFYPLPVLLVVLALFPWVLSMGGTIDLRFDALDHIAYMREIQATGNNFPLTAYFDPSTDETLDIRKGFMQPFFAAVAARADADVIDLWNALPAVAMLFFSLSFFALASEAIGGAAGAAAWLLALFFFDRGVGGSWFSRAGAPFLFSGPLIWCALLMILRAARQRKTEILPALVIGVALMGSHIFAAVTAAMMGAFHVVL